MNARIEFIKNKKGTNFTNYKINKITKWKTGTATFIFVQPSLFMNTNFQINSINGMYLLWENDKIETRDIEIFLKMVIRT